MLCRGSLLFLCLVVLTSATAGAQTVPDVDLTEYAPSDFADDELDLPYYLAHFSTLANSVRMDGPDRGFIDLAVWRNPDLNQPGNPRIMENVVSLAFFYATDRPWNPYYGHPALRERLEAALSYWIGLQHADGRFGSSGAFGRTASVTAFTTKFLGETLRLISDGPTIDGNVLALAFTAQRRAIAALLQREDLFERAERFANQYTNVWGGALSYLELRPDPALRRLLERRLRSTLSDAQSPAGYFYEHGGPDWTYDIETHHSNHRMAWHFLRGSALGDVYADHVRRWYAWLADNAALEPDASGFTMNHGFETRLSFPFYRENRATMFGETCSPLAEVVETARAFCESEDEREIRSRRERRELERSWPAVRPLEAGSFGAYSPYAFLHRNHYAWFPTMEEKAAARARLPYVHSDSYMRIRSDDRRNLAVVLARRPSYYAAFSSGEALTAQQRFGLGLLWHPDIGSVIQSQSGLDYSWGTVLAGTQTVVESDLPSLETSWNDRSVGEGAGTLQDEGDDVWITYPLGDDGTKTVRFPRDRVLVEVQYPGRFEETIPLLVGGEDDVQLDGSRIRIRTPRGRFEIRIDEAARPVLEETDRRIGRKRVVMLRLGSSGGLTYGLHFDPGG